MESLLANDSFDATKHDRSDCQIDCPKAPCRHCQGSRLWAKSGKRPGRKRMTKHKKIMTAAEMARTLERLAFELIERHEQGCGLALVGIQRRGAELASRLKGHHRGQAQVRGAPGQARYQPLPGRLDPFRGPAPGRGVAPSRFRSTKKNVVLVDDVLFSGRTHPGRPGSHPWDYGRPKRVELLVLIDRRGHRELPIPRPTTWAKRSTPPRVRACGRVRGRTLDDEDTVSPGALAVAGSTGLTPQSFWRRPWAQWGVPRCRFSCRCLGTVFGTFLSDPRGTRRQGISARSAKRRYPCMSSP